MELFGQWLVADHIVEQCHKRSNIFSIWQEVRVELSVYVESFWLTVYYS